MSGILGASDLTADVDRTCDVCIIGTGAGGAVLGAGLAAAGLDVVFLEEGGHYTRHDFDMQEATAYPRLYQERGTRATADLAITVLQGRSVGGSTTINWTTCFRTPERILAHWAAEHGIEGLTLDPHFEAVEDRLNIAEWPEALANANNQALLRGARALGWEARPLRRNVRGCANSGYCGMGCPVDGKQAMGITYIADAVAAGATVYANTRAERLELEHHRVKAVHGRVWSPQAPRADGARVTVRPKVTVSAGGAINGPALLLRSGLDGGGRVGKRTFLHPVIGLMGRYADPVNPFYGAPQSIGSHQFIDRGPDRLGYFFEAAPLHPMLAATATSAFGTALQDFLGQLPHISAIIALAVDGLLPGDEGGTVSLRPDGRVQVDYPVGPALVESIQDAHQTIARLHLAAGAELTGTLHHEPVLLRSEADLPRLDTAPYGAHEHAIFTAHQMGGCAMGADPSRHPVDTEHRFRGVEGLFVVDGSVLPTALGVNPSETIYGLAHRAIDPIRAAV